MKTYWIFCRKCGKELLHGTEAPERPEFCSTARAIRMGCRARGCDLELRETERELDMMDKIRLGLVDEAEAWKQLREESKCAAARPA